MTLLIVKDEMINIYSGVIGIIITVISRCIVTIGINQEGFGLRMKEVDFVDYRASFIFFQRGFLLIRDTAVNNIKKSRKEFLSFLKINNYG